MTHISGRTSAQEYRPYIDGLRAIAVLAVVCFHAFPDWVSGGFIGVDIFFVISGFLISTILFNSLDKKQFSFIEFYARRIRRIFPALILVITACYAFGWFVLLADEYKRLGKFMFGGAGFFSNFLFLRESGYFNADAQSEPLLHLWSLSIEEQYYLVWPLLLWILWGQKRTLWLTILCLAAISFVLNVIGTNADAIVTFYSPHTRFWELLCGSLLAWVTLFKVNSNLMVNSRSGLLKNLPEIWKNAATHSRTLNNLISFAGFSLILFSIFQITDKAQFPGYWALLPTLGTALTIYAGDSAWINQRILSSKLLVWIGLISFPLYLWHWPLLSFARIMYGEVPSIEIRVILVLASLIFAALTYHLIEGPVRYGAQRKLETAGLVIGIFILGYLGYYTWVTDGLSFRVKKFHEIELASHEWQYPDLLKPYHFEGENFYFAESGKKQLTLFVGDSNIAQYYARINELIRTVPAVTNSAIFATGNGCLPIADSPFDERHRHCVNLMSEALKLASDKPEIENVVIGSEWNGHLADGAGLLGTFGHGSAPYSAALSRLGQHIHFLKENNKKVFLILNIPVGSSLDPRYMVQRNLKNLPAVLSLRDGGISRKSLSERYGSIQQDLRNVAENAGATVIDPVDLLCDDVFCPSVDKNGDPIYKDSGHLRPSYVRKYASFMDLTVQ